MHSGESSICSSWPTTTVEGGSSGHNRRKTRKTRPFFAGNCRFAASDAAFPRKVGTRLRTCVRPRRSSRQNSSSSFKKQGASASVGAPCFLASSGWCEGDRSRSALRGSHEPAEWGPERFFSVPGHTYPHVHEPDEPTFCVEALKQQLSVGFWLTPYTGNNSIPARYPFRTDYGG